MIKVTIKLTSGSEITAGFVSPAPGETWSWVKSTIAEAFECGESSIVLVETDEGDAITVDGEVVGWLL